MAIEGSAPKAQTILLGLAYDGAPWAGLAPQHNAETVGGALLDAIHHIDPGVTKLRLASRTDAGVHARDNRVAFDTERDMPTRGWVLGLRQHLPRSIAVRWAARAPWRFNPRFETSEKLYRYLVLCDALDDPFFSRRAWRIHDLDPASITVMQSELEPVLGEHDFSAFASSRDEREHRRRTMTHIAVHLLEPRLIAIDIRGNGFLHNMVRILVGTAVDVARGRKAPGSIARALASLERMDGGETAPPDGLYLEKLWSAFDGDDRWPANRGRVIDSAL